MLEKAKNFFAFKSIDKLINEKNYEKALDVLNMLIKEQFRLSTTYLKRGKLCHKLLMYDEAYSDYTYVISHCVDKYDAYFNRMKLNYEISNYNGVIADANCVLNENSAEQECYRYKFLSLVFLSEEELASKLIMQISDENKYKAIQYILQEVANNIAANELSKALKLLEIIEIIDPSNPMKIFQQANIYGLAGDINKEKELLKLIDSVFPKYFISHFRFTDMFQTRDLLEVSFLLELKIFDKLNDFAYPLSILEGYKNQMQGHISDSKESFEKAIEINPNRPEAYVLLAQTLQLMSGYSNPAYKKYAEENYIKAMNIYDKENLYAKSDEMKRQIKHLNSMLSIQ